MCGLAHNNKEEQHNMDGIPIGYGFTPEGSMTALSASLTYIYGVGLVCGPIITGTQIAEEEYGRLCMCPTIMSSKLISMDLDIFIITNSILHCQCMTSMQ